MTSRHSVARDRPIFVDRTGRRRRWITALGAGGGTLLISSVGVLIAGILGAGPGRLPGLPGIGPQHPQGAAASMTAGPASSPSRSSARTGGASPTATAGPTLLAGVPSPTPSPRAKGRPTDAPSHPTRPSKNH